MPSGARGPDGSPSPAYSSDSRWATGDLQLEAGAEVGEYVVEGMLGKGAFGSVYRAVHPMIGKLVAIKVLNLKYSADPEMASRFVSEARAVNRIGHEGIVDIFGFGELPDGRKYYVMAALDGVTLYDYLSEHGRISVEETIHILGGVAEALDAAHATGVTHRDLKPGNIFLVRTADEGWRPKLLDFGVAKLMDEETPRAHKTETGAALGTPAYMSPEQCRGRDVDHRSDVYAFGVVAFQMLTGQLPFDSDSVFAIMNGHVFEPPPPPREIVPELSEEVSAAVLWLLEKEPDARPQTLAEAMAAFRGNEPPPPRPPGSGSTPMPAATTSGNITRSDRPQTFDTFGDRSVTGPVAPSGSQSALRWAAIGLVVTALGIAGATILMKPAEVLVEPAQASAPASEAVEAPAPATADATKTVTVELTGLPAGAQVKDSNGKLLRTGPGPIELDQSETPVEISVEAEGFVAVTRRLVPAEAATVQVDLRPVPARAPPPRVQPAPTPVKPKPTPTKKKTRGMDDLEPWE